MSPADTSTYKLYYFPLRGRAEVIRLIFSYAGVRYEEVQVTNEEWRNHGAIRKEMPLDEMPVLIVDGVKVPQSYAIYRFLGKRFDVENALLDAYTDACRDMCELLREWRWMVGKYIPGDPNEKYETEAKAVIAKYASYFQSILGKRKWLLGDDRVTWADIAVAESMYQLRVMRDNVLDEYPIIREWIERMHRLPGIVDYLPNRMAKTYFWQ